MTGDRFEDVQKAIDREWMFQALREMILIRSENPFDETPAEGYREKEMADCLAGHLSARFPFFHRFPGQHMPASQYS